ncbi:MAG: YfiR family protein [Bacteroidia bacterium]|nr:YfiR family protein [Bacteroidia bacterium]
MKIFLRYIFFCIFGFLVLTSFKQDFDVNAKIKAVYIYNLTRYFEWPSSSKSGNFIIQIVGNANALIKELNENVVSKKTIGGQKIELINSDKIDKNKIPQVLFITPEHSASIKAYASQLKNKGTLLITEQEGAAKTYAVVNFVVIENKQKFEYNKQNAAKYGLKASEDIKNLASAVY